MIAGRELNKDEVNLIWTIDRSEIVNNVYYYKDGALVLKPEHYDIHGWPAHGPKEYTPILTDCIERGGWFFGFFDNENLVGVVILENDFIGSKKDQLQLKFLHVSKDYRGQGLGKKLFKLASDKAKENGAKRLYISATPSEQTIKFYQSMGCTVTKELDPDLFKLEPDDIHLEYQIRSQGMKSRVERINPYLNVQDISTSLRYYVDVLGFDLYVETPNIGIVERDGHQIHLIKGKDRDIAQRVWIGVGDVVVLFEQLKENGAKISQEPTNYSWAYQMIVEDLDANMLIYGSAPIEGQPFQD